MRNKIFSLILLFTLTLAAETISPQNLIGTNAPSFFMKNANSDVRSFVKLDEELAKDNGVVLVFFASWCIPCHQEIAFLKEMSVSSQVSVIAVLVENSWSDKEKGIINSLYPNIPVVVDSYKIIQKKYGFSGRLPYTVYIKKDGTIEAIGTAFSEKHKEWIQKTIHKL